MRNRDKKTLFCMIFILIWGVALAQSVTITPDDIDFGDVELGSLMFQQVTISTVLSYANLTALSISGDPAFSIYSPPTLPYPLSPVTPLTISIACQPSSIGYKVATLSISTSVGVNKTIPMTANGIPAPPAAPMFAIPPNYDFGSVAIGSVATYDYDLQLSPDWLALFSSGEVQNISVTGASAFQLVSVTEPSSVISISYPYILNDPNWLDVSVSFSPTNTDTLSATLTVLDVDNNTYETQLIGHGAPPAPEIRVEPNSLIVSVAVNDSLASGFQVFNDGGSNLAYTIDSSTLPYWIYLGSNLGSVLPMGSIPVQVFVVPTAVIPGNYSYVISINSNDPMNASLNLMITVEVSAMPLTADFHAIPAQGHAPLAVDFFDDSTPGDASAWAAISSWNWDFQNDGVFDSNLQNPTYTYQKQGLYSVRLVVQTVSGMLSEAVKTDYIEVQNQAPVVWNPLAPITINEDTPWGPSYINTVFSDPDGDAITISGIDSDHLSTNIVGFTLTITPAEDWNGTESIILIASDSFGGSVQHEVSVTVLPVNDAPVLNVPPDLYFLCNSLYSVDFGPYIDDPDNPDNQCSISISNLGGPGMIGWSYFPVNEPNIVGQLGVQFTYGAPTQEVQQDVFTISVNDNMGRLIATQDFTVHVIDHFVPAFTVADVYQYTGQTVGFNDATQGNPSYWYWTFGDGGTSEEQHPQHQYLNAGTYDVVLRLGYTGLPNEERQITMQSLIHLVGTAVTVDYIPANWTYQNSPYNLFGDVVIDGTTNVVIEPEVVVNMDSEQPILVAGSLNASGVRFQPISASSTWGGLRFTGSQSREISHLLDCEIVDAVNPIEIIDGAPVLDGVTITVADTLARRAGTGILINGNSGCSISNTEILNYGGGLVVETDGGTRDTPVLTNIRVRNSSNSVREVDADESGVTITGVALLQNVEVDNFTTGLTIGTNELRVDTTPTLTNIRVRNSSNTQRDGATTGIRIIGNSAPDIEELSIWDVDNGLILENVSPTTRETITLTNIRVRNSSNTQRSITNGMIIRDTPQLTIVDAEFDDFATGIMIEASGTRELSTPTLTNIRVRNSSNTQRTATTGITLSGAVTARLDDVEVVDYTYGLVYDYDAGMRVVASPVLTNIRVRNSSNTQRQEGIGAQFNELERISINDMQVDNYNTGIKIMAPLGRTVSTPTLTNIRVRNSSNTQRDTNTGIILGSGVEGSLKDSRITEATVGIMIAEGNRTVIKNNLIENCLTGIQAYGGNPLPIQKLSFVIHDFYRNLFPEGDFTALQLTGPGPWNVHQNTIFNYKKGLVLQDAQLNLHSNILWTTYHDLQPVVVFNSQYTADYNNIFYAGAVFPGVSNINANPEFALSDSIDFHILRDSPCIDAGSPSLPHDADGSIADQGAFPYLHRVSAAVYPRFVTVGSQVTFTNTSIGHDWPDTQVSWYVNGDEVMDSNSRDFTYTYNAPGVYNIILRMQSGSLDDVRIYPAFVVVSTYQLPQPMNPQLGRLDSDLVLSWEPVTQTVEGLPVNISHYLVFRADKPDGIFFFRDYVTDQTSFRDFGGALENRGFYRVIGFIGTREELENYISRCARQKQVIE